MAYKQKGCSPITAKIKRTTQGGMVTQPILNMGAPVKMKMSSPAKQVDGDLSMTPYEVKTEYANYVEKNPKVTKRTGVINGPKVSYDMAYNKAKKTKRYAGMSKAEYIKEAKRQTKSFTETGNWDAKPKRAKATKVSTLKPASVEPLSKEIKIETKIDASAIKPKDKKAAKAKPTRSQKIRAKGEAALASGNTDKAQRLRKRYDRVEAREAKRTARKAARVARRAAK
tara:strand:+ start:1702 stop:2382 length:681 start_codon:yes stop_codon:yes gene_type:complete